MFAYENNLKQILKYLNVAIIFHIPVYLYMAKFFGTEYSIAIGGPLILLVGQLIFQYLFKSLNIASILMGFTMMSMSAIMIHLGKGMIEWHFHIFVMIGILSLFANPYTIIAAALTAAIHHTVFYFYLPASIFNYEASIWIVAIHAAFVVVESIACVFLSLRFKASLDLQKKISQEISPLVTSIDKIARDSKEASVSLLKYSDSNSSNITEISSSAEEITKMAQSTMSQIKRCLDLMSETNQSMSKSSTIIGEGELFLKKLDEIRTKMKSLEENSAIKLGEVEESVQYISEKTSVITDIVFQTKLLSFNASVEAARAGENGKGFAVVAEEIGALANTSGKASDEIETIVERSKNQLNSSVKEIREQIKSYQKDIQGAFSTWQNINTQLHESFNQVKNNSSLQDNSLQEISKATGEQNTGVNELSRSLNDIDQASHESLQKLKQVEEMVSQLEAHSDKLASINSEINPS